MPKKIVAKIARKKVIEKAKNNLKKAGKIVGLSVIKTKSATKKTLKTHGKKAVSYAKKNPKKIAVIGAGVGLAIGAMIMKAFKKRKKV